MRMFPRLAGLVLLLLALPVVVADDKKPESKETKKGDAPKTQVVNKIAAKIVSVDADEKKLTVELAVPTSRGRSYRAVKEELPYADDVKVRVPYLPDQTDANGKKKKLTAAEKAKLKGDPKLPGYAADLSQVVPGAIVELEMSVHKPGPGDAKKGVVEMPYVSMIVIVLTEAQKPAPLKPKAEKKKK